MGLLLVVSAPSGAGKTTICNRLLARVNSLQYSISYTTRKPRPGEVDGREYFFLSEDRFKEMIADRAFLEWANVFSRFYGTGREWVEHRLAEGNDVLVDVDVAGARQIKANFPDAVLVFIVPPTLAELQRRLKDRQTESDEEILERLGRVREEVESRDIYDYLVVNDQVDEAVDDMRAIIRTEKKRMTRAVGFWTGFLQNGG